MNMSIEQAHVLKTELHFHALRLQQAQADMQVLLSSHKLLFQLLPEQTSWVEQNCQSIMRVEYDIVTLKAEVDHTQQMIDILEEVLFDYDLTSCSNNQKH